MRKETCLVLRATHWDFNPDFEHIPCERALVRTRSKTKATQEQLIPIIKLLHDILERLQGREPNLHNLVFTNPDGSAISQSQDQNARRRLLELAGVPHRKQQTLRSTEATLLRTAQVDEATRMERFGTPKRAGSASRPAQTSSSIGAAMGKLDLLTLQDLDG